MYEQKVFPAPEKEQKEIINSYKIYEGNCLDILQGFDKNSFDLIVTDPPYFLPIQSYVGTRENGYARRTLADTSILKGFFERVFQELNRVLTDDGIYYVFCDAKSYPIFYETLFPYTKHVRLLIWDKLVSYNGYTWRHQHELITWGEKQDTIRVPTGDGDILKFRGVLQDDRLHPAEKPVGLLKLLIEKHEYYNVLDPFAGSGSTMAACQELGKNCVAIELDPIHCETIKTRCFNKTFLDREVTYDFIRKRESKEDK